MAEEKIKKAEAAVGEEKPLLEWESPEFFQYKKDTGWFVTITLIALVLAVILFKLGLGSGALFVLIAALAFMSLSNTHPRTVKCALHEMGVVNNGKIYQYDQFKSFRITEGEIVKAKLDLAGKFGGEVVLPLRNVNAETVRSILLKHLPESNKSDGDWTDFVERLMKF